MGTTLTRIAASGIALAAISLAAAQPASAAMVDISGTDPATTGCSSGAYTIATRSILDSSGRTYGSMEVRWSPNCQSNWVRVTPVSGLSGTMSKYIYRGKSYLAAGGAIQAFSNTTVDTASAASYGMQAWVPLSGDNQCVTVRAQYVNAAGQLVASTGSAQTGGMITIC